MRQLFIRYCTLFLGSVIIFTGLLSVLYLKTKLLMFHWFGMFLVTLGLITIGICDMAYNGGGAASSNMVTGMFIYNFKTLFF